MLRRKLSGLIAGTLITIPVVAAVILVGGSGQAAATSQHSTGKTQTPYGSAPTALVAADVGKVTGTGEIEVSWLEPKDIGAHGVPRRLVAVPAATIPVSGGGLHMLRVPLPAASVERASDGVANLQMTAEYGNRIATTNVSVSAASKRLEYARPAEQAMFAKFRTDPAAAGAVSMVAQEIGAAAPLATTVTSGTGTTPTGTSTGTTTTTGGHRPPPNCTWQAYGSSSAVTARIGELHVADESGSAGSYLYGSGTSSTFSVGASSSPSSGYSKAGTETVVSTSSSSVTGGAGYRWYIDGQFYEQRYEVIGSGCDEPSYEVRIVSADGNAVKGTNQPAENPWGGCPNDPHGDVLITSGSTYTDERGSAVTYSAAVNLYGMNASGQTGYNNTSGTRYNNQSNRTLYACGSATMPSVPVVYETP